MTGEKEIQKLKQDIEEKEGLIKRQREELLSLHSVSQYLVSETNLEDLLTRIATHIGKYLGAKFVTFWMLEENKKFLFVKAAYGMSQLHIKYSRGEGHLNVNEAWVGRAVRDKKPYFSEDVSQDLKLPKRWMEKVKKLNLRGLICLPIIVADESVGGLCVYWTEARKFENFEIRLLSVVANQAATAIKDIQIYQELQKGTDELEKTRLALVNMLEDTDEARKKTEEEKDKTLAIITNFADGLLFFDAENNLSLINPQAETFFGVQGKDVVGKSVPELSAFPALLPLVELLGGEIKSIFRKELSVREKQTLELSIILVMSGKKTIGSLAILHDITREKTIERMKTEFVSLSAHQLRTPLSAIKWTLKMFLDGDIGEITNEQRSFIEKTYQSNERMIALINDLLDVTRIEEGRYLHKPVLIDIEPVVQSVIDSYRDELKGKNLKLEFQKPRKKLPRITLDTEKIKLAIQNLIDNAVKYTFPGNKITISILHNVGKEEIEFQIRDAGMGIPKEQQERVFTKFFRAENAAKADTTGSGLGLFLAKNIIEAHGGRIWFKSPVFTDGSAEGKGGGGTIFYFILPVKKEFDVFLKGL
ncbi:MAG: ATP-binding protein [bacterium]|nr:ATP-binding protein [bacterium]